MAIVDEELVMWLLSEGVSVCLQESLAPVLCQWGPFDDQVRNIVLECFWSKERSLEREPEELEKIPCIGGMVLLL